MWISLLLSLYAWAILASNTFVREVSFSFHFRAALHRRGFDFNSAVDDLLVAMDKTDHDETHPIYKEAQKQLLLNYNDFAVECFR